MGAWARGLAVGQFLGELGARTVLVATAATLTTGTRPLLLVLPKLALAGQFVRAGHLLVAAAELLLGLAIALGLGQVASALLLVERFGDGALELGGGEAVFAREAFGLLLARTAGEPTHGGGEHRHHVDDLAAREGGGGRFDDGAEPGVQREFGLEDLTRVAALPELLAVVLLDLAVLQLLAELQPGVALLLELRMARGAVADGLETLHQRVGVARELGAAGVLEHDRLGQERLRVHPLARADLRERWDEELVGRGLLAAGLAGVELRRLRRLDLDLGHGGLGRGLGDDGLGDNLGHGGLDHLLDHRRGLQRRELLAAQAGQDLARRELLQRGHVGAVRDQVRDLGHGVDADQLAIGAEPRRVDAILVQRGGRLDRGRVAVLHDVRALGLGHVSLGQAVEVQAGVEHRDDGLLELAHGNS